MAFHIPTIEDIREAARRLSGDVHETPVLTSKTFDELTSTRCFLKAENVQRVGAFKIRGALNKLRTLSDEERARGVITYSSGNHGQATACAARLENVSCVVVMPEDARAAKRNATLAYGAEVTTAGTTSEDRHTRAMELQERHGYTVIPPYEDPLIIAGQGTCGLEVVRQVPDLDVLLVPVGGGGLISGCALAVKSLMPSVEVIGVETAGADDATQSFHRKELIRYASTDTIADGMRNLSVGKLNFELMLDYVDDMITVSDSDVVAMMRFFFERMKMVVEPTGAVTATAARVHAHRFAGKTVCAVVSGGNIGTEDFCALTASGGSAS
ncbi:MAG: threonine/serine dehydratase [Spirochaetaceae bacterium]